MKACRALDALLFAMIVPGDDWLIEQAVVSQAGAALPLEVT